MALKCIAELWNQVKMFDDEFCPLLFPSFVSIVKKIYIEPSLTQNWLFEFSHYLKLHTASAEVHWWRTPLRVKWQVLSHTWSVSLSRKTLHLPPFHDCWTFHPYFLKDSPDRLEKLWQQPHAVCFDGNKTYLDFSGDIHTATVLQSKLPTSSGWPSRKWRLLTL